MTSHDRVELSQARYWHLGNQIAAEHTYAAKTDARHWLSTVEADIVPGDRVDPDAARSPSAGTPTGGSSSARSGRARSSGWHGE